MFCHAIESAAEHAGREGAHGDADISDANQSVDHDLRVLANTKQKSTTKMDNPGFDPGTSRMRSERSTN